MTIEEVKFDRKHYMRLPEGFPAQLIHGWLVKDPAPAPWHQVVVMRVRDALADFVRSRERVLASPVDVFIGDDTVLQPDVLVLPAGGRVGPLDREIPLPVLVVEVLSPTTAGRDRGVKARIYLDAGVREVWLVDPEARTVEVRTPTDSTHAGRGEAAVSSVLDGFRLVSCSRSSLQFCTAASRAAALLVSHDPTGSLPPRALHPGRFGASFVTRTSRTGH